MGTPERIRFKSILEGLFCLLLVIFPIGCNKMDDDTAGKLPDRIVEPESVDFRPMPHSTHDERDAEILKILVREKADLSKARHSLFYLYFPTNDQASAARSEVLKLEIAKEKDFKAEVETSATGTDWLCLVQAEMVINATVISRLRSQFEAIAKRGQGEYDGWECAAVP